MLEASLSRRVMLQKEVREGWREGGREAGRQMGQAGGAGEQPRWLSG